jgi:hypothetical protein
MAGSNILTYALLGGAAYLAYNYFTSQPATTTTTTTGGSTPPPPPPVAYVPPIMSAQLQALAGSATMLNADQWNYYYTSPAPQGLAQPTITNFDTIFFPNGRPADPTNNPTMTAAAFVAALGIKGLSGLGYRRYIPVPRLVTMRDRGFGQYTLADLRRAGRR